MPTAVPEVSSASRPSLPLVRAAASSRSGFTLVEMLAVLSIVAILMTASIPALRSITTVAGKQGAVGTLIGTFEQARVMALSNGLPVYVAFADEQAPERFRYRAFQVLQEVEVNGQIEIKAVTAWRQLPRNVSFKPENNSLIGSNKKINVQFPGETKAENTQTAQVPCLKFNENGMVEAPNNVLLQIILFDGFIDDNGKPRNLTGASAAADDAGVDEENLPIYFDVVKVSKFTGRARWLTAP